MQSRTGLLGSTEGESHEMPEMAIPIGSGLSAYQNKVVIWSYHLWQRLFAWFVRPV